MLWIIPALASALLWGIDYTLQERMFEQIQPVTALFYISVASAIAFGVFGRQTIREDTEIMLEHSGLLMFSLITMGTGTFANLFTAIAIQEENATVVGMIEITYPFFVMIFNFLFFQKDDMFHLNNIIGGTLILFGIWFLWR